MGGQVAYGPGQQTFDVGAALSEGNGVIEVDNNPLLIAVLDQYPALKHVSGPKADEIAAEAEMPPTGKLKKAELLKLADERDVDTSDDPTVEELRDRLAAKAMEVESGAAEHTDDTLAGMSRSELFDLATSMNLDITGDENEADLRRLINDNEGGSAG